MQINVTRKEMEIAYRNHKSVWESGKDTPNNSHKMILFYAVECGLKVYFMKHNSLEQAYETNQNNESPLKFGHKIRDLCEKLNIKLKISRITKNVDKPIEPQDFHQAWRYGKQLDKDEENVCIEEFQRILEELNKKLM